MNDDHEHESLPPGFRQGIITAITVLLGFAGAMVLAVVMQVIALVRSLRIEDDDPREYRKTVSWLTASAIVMLAGMLFATIVFSAGAKP
jgi:uncharacterized membrane protein required for colicin V production